MNTLTYHQLQGAKQLQVIISLSPETVQLLDSNIPHQLSISYNSINIEISSLAQLYHTLTALFASYIHSNNIGAELELQEEEEQYHNTTAFQNHKQKHLLFHSDLEEKQPTELPLYFVQQCDHSHDFGILHSIIKYVENFPTPLSLGQVEHISYIWPQYTTLVDNFIEWVDTVENFSDTELYYTQIYDSLADSLEDQIYTVANNIHKCIQTIPSRYYKRH